MKSIVKSSAIILFAGISIASQAQSGLDLLKAMEKKNAGIKSVSGSLTQFQQERGQAIKQTPANFKLVKPDGVRYDLKGTAQSSNIIHQNTMYSYVPALKQVSVTKIKDSSTQPELAMLMLGFGTKAETLSKQYTIAPLSNANGVSLKSKSQQLSYTIEVDPSSMLPTRLTRTDQAGTFSGVDINLSTLSFNTVQPNEIEPNFPKGIHTVNTN